MIKYIIFIALIIFAVYQGILLVKDINKKRKNKDKGEKINNDSNNDRNS